MTSRRLLKVKCHQSRFRLRPCQGSRRVPQERSALQQHPIPKHPHLDLPNPRRDMTDVSRLRAQWPNEKPRLKQNNFLRMPRPPRNFSPSLSKKQMSWNAINALLDLNVVKKMESCNAADAMFWCHPCGFAYCLDCRVHGLACDHHIINYSSELSSDFMPDSIGSKDSPFDIGVLIEAVLAESAYFGATRTEQAQTRQENYEDLVRHLKEGNKFGNSYLQSFVKHGIEDFDYAEFIYRMDGANRVPTLKEHFLDAQDETPLPIWRPEVFFKYPNGPDLTEKEIGRLPELFRSCLLGMLAVQGVALRTEKNINDTQKDSYQLGILTLNLGHINGVPYIGGSSKFPSWVRKDIQYRALPYLVFRHSAHITCLCEAYDEYGGIAPHQQEARDHSMIGMVYPEIKCQSVAIFIRGDHSVGTFIELLGHYHCVSENKKDPNNFGYFMEQFFAYVMARTPQENS